MSAETATSGTGTNQGSWLPMVTIIILVLLRWLYYGAGDVPTKFRRWNKNQTIRLRQKLGYRDASVYKSGAAGHGSSAQVKRQG